MKKSQSILKKQSVDRRRKKRKAKGGVAVFSLIRRVVVIASKCVVIIALVFGISVLLMYGYDYLHTSSFLMLERIEVVGVEQEIERELIALADIGKRSNLLFLSLRKLKKKMEAHPWIKTVKLNRCFPHTLLIKAEKHEPTAIVIRNGIYYMNQKFEIFKEVDDSDEIDFPIITGISGNDAEARIQLACAGEIMSILSSQKEPWSLDKLSEIHVNGGNISLYFSHLPVEIRADYDDLAFKIDGLRNVTRHLHKTGRIDLVTRIDLNSVEGAVVSFKKG